jgi:hypothetical protein
MFSSYSDDEKEIPEKAILKISPTIQHFIGDHRN